MESEVSTPSRESFQDLEQSSATNSSVVKKESPPPPPPPPYWQHYGRSASYASQASLDAGPPPILLEDNTESPSGSGLWAKAVTIGDYVVVRGSTPAIGAYVVYNCRFQTLDGGPLVVRKRYSEFDELREKLAQAFPHSKTSLPPLPPKSLLYKFRPRFLEKRRSGLSYFLNCVMLNPEFAGSPIVKDFIFSHED